MTQGSKYHDSRFQVTQGSRYHDPRFQARKASSAARAGVSGSSWHTAQAASLSATAAAAKLRVSRAQSVLGAARGPGPGGGPQAATATLPPAGGPLSYICKPDRGPVQFYVQYRATLYNIDVH